MMSWKSPFSRYVLKVTISRGYAGSIMEYQDLVVVYFALSLSLSLPPPPPHLCASVFDDFKFAFLYFAKAKKFNLKLYVAFT
jgi:hypothetical protein